MTFSSRLCGIPETDDDALLHDALRLVEVDWVHKFIFGTEASAQAEILQSPLRSANAVALQTRACAKDEYDHEEDANCVKSTLILVPAYAYENISVGLGIDDTSSSEAHVTRYARNDDSGETVCVSDVQLGGYIDLEYVSPLSGQHSTRAYLRLFCGQSAFPVPGTGSIVQCIALHESRSRCLHTATFRRALHALDFAHHAHNVHALLGEFHGEGTIREYSQGHCMRTERLSTVLVTKAAQMEDVSLLLKWAIADRLARAQQEKPRAIAIAPKGECTQHIETLSKTERRLMQKRVAAQKSNKRRREAAKLEKGLKEAKKKVATLQERERSLREENYQLRRHFKNN